MATFATMNLTHLFYSCTALEVVSGLGNLAGVKSCGSRSLRARRPPSWTSEASTVCAHRPDLLLLGVLVAGDDLRRRHLGAAFERGFGLAVLL